jgi:hypothetical protein
LLLLFLLLFLLLLSAAEINSTPAPLTASNKLVGATVSAERLVV